MNARPIFDAVEELSAYKVDLQRATHSMFDSVLARYVALLKSRTPLGDIGDGDLPRMNFDSWWEEGASKAGSLVGSGRLDWPVDRKHRVALQLELLRRMADGKPD